MTTNKDQKVEIRDNTIAMKLYLGAPGRNTKVRDKSAVTVEDADKDRLTIRKEIFKCPEMVACVRQHAAIRLYVKNQVALPCPLFNHGTYLVPISMMESVIDTLKMMEVDWFEKIDRFLAVYPSIIDQDREKLGPLFDEVDYPAPEALRASFGMEVTFIEFSNPTSLANIDSTLFEAQKKRFEQMWKDAEMAAIQLLRVQMKELVQHMVDRTSAGKDGKKKIFRDTLTTNIREFFASFPFRNVMDDAELAAVVAQAKDLLDGVDAGDLRDNEAIRGAVNKGFAKLQSNLDEMLEAEPIRAISFDDE